MIRRGRRRASKLPRKLSSPEPHLADSFASRYADPYDAEVAFSDRIVGELLDSLRQLDLYDEALIVFLSDHGESLGEHGQPAHETLIYREAIQVPLMLKLPGAIRAGETVERPVQLIDVLPTIAQIVGLELPDTLRGTSLLADRRDGPTRIYAESYYARLHFGWSEQRSIIDETFQYLRGPDDEIYDLSSDPAQVRNLVRQQRRLVEERAAEVDTLSADFESPSEADPDTLAKLAALGYLGGSVDSSDVETLPDPREKTEVLAALNSGLELLRQRRYAEAAQSLEVVVVSEPNLVDAWGHLGKALKNSGDLDGALQAYEKALDLSSGAPQIALAAALLYFERKEMAEARLHAELAAASHPEAYDVLAQIALHQGELEAAARHVEDAMATRGSRIGPLVTRARLRLRQGRHAEALELTLEVEEEFGARRDYEVLKSLYFTRGSSLAHLDRYPEAIEAFRTEIEHTPTALAPYSHLAVLYALTGQTPEIGLTLKSLVENNPTPAAHAEAVRTLRQLGDMQSAGALLAGALQLWPRNAELQGLARAGTR